MRDEFPQVLNYGRIHACLFCPAERNRLNNKLIADLPADLRPYEKCEKYGVETLTDPELLAVILKTGSREKSAVSLAEEILFSDGIDCGLLNLMHCGPEDYKAIKGVGRVKALQLLCVAELAKRISRKRAESRLDLSSPASIADYYMEHLRHCTEEEVHLMLADSRGRMIRSALISRGTVNLSAVSPREIFSCALRHGAASFVLIHNHPSGQPEPSREDILMTSSLLQGGQLMNIPLIDSLIIGDGIYYSFFEDGVLTRLDSAMNDPLSDVAES